MIDLLSEKIFIAGAHGMVGNAICRELKKDLIYLKNENILTPKKNELNLANFQELENWFLKNKPTIVIIAAAKVGGILANFKKPYEFIIENLKIQTNLIELSFKHKVKKLLFLGSSCIYPKFSNQPIKENSLLTGSLESTNEFYAIAKISGIKLCQALIKQYNFNCVCLMPANLYGKGDYYNTTYGHVVPSLIKKFYDAKIQNLKSVTCWGSGEILREFLYVDDLANACIYALKNVSFNSEKSENNMFDDQLPWINVGSKFETSIKNLANIIAKTVEYNGEIIWDKSKPDGTPRKKLNTEKMEKLGWRACTDLENGIELTLKHFKEELRNNTLRT